tara:strand:+ start:902 stop:1102 length:201 start_codon:yes stop_codon:yes gene_type:complete
MMEAEGAFAVGEKHHSQFAAAKCEFKPTTPDGLLGIECATNDELTGEDFVQRGSKPLRFEASERFS